VLPEAGKDYEGSEMEVWGTMTAAKFDLVYNKVIDLRTYRTHSTPIVYQPLQYCER
jgi:hypothetical protein